MEYYDNGISPSVISFTTAEPTLRDDLPEILRYTVRRYPHAKISLLTNARMFSYPPYLKKYKGFLGRIQFEIPLHGPEKIHDSLTRVSGSYNQTIQGCQNLFAAAPKAKI